MSADSTPLAPGLYLVATPIGNLGDITLRALDVLRGVDRIACEDTRQTQKLLNHFQIAKPTVSYHQHNRRFRSTNIVSWCFPLPLYPLPRVSPCRPLQPLPAAHALEAVSCRASPAYRKSGRNWSAVAFPLDCPGTFCCPSCLCAGSSHAFAAHQALTAGIRFPAVIAGTWP